MVASIAQMRAGIETYYTDLAREDYYLEGGEPPGRWIGSAAEKLGLTGKVSKEELSRILQGFDKEGRQLVRNAGADNRQVGWDVTFSAPKDVSVIWGIGNEQQRTLIEKCHNKATNVALEFLQQNVIWSRTGAGGANWQKAEAVVATFLHGTSRDVDPNLHTHSLFINLGVREDGQTGTIVSKKLYDYKMVAGLIYRAALAESLNRDLGFELKQVESWFEIKGFSAEARDFFSKRRNAIEEAVGPEATSKAKDNANLRTRQVKGHVARDELHPEWREQAKDFGLDQDYVDGLFQEGKARVEDFERAEQTCQQAMDSLAESEGAFNERDFLRSALSKLQTGDVDLETILDKCREALKQSNVVDLGQDSSRDGYFTTKKQLDRENEVLGIASKIASRNGKGVSRATVAKIVEGSSFDRIARSVEAFVFEKLPKRIQFHFMPQKLQLNELQEKALYKITSEAGSLKIVSGRAGTGKTTMLSAAREVWESQGLNVIGCSVSGKAAQELAAGAGIDSETVAMRLLQTDNSALKMLGHEAKQLMRAFLGKNRYELEKLKLNSKSVLVIDEASMLDTKQMATLLKRAEKAKAKVVMVGDIRQLPSIDAGGGFAKLFKENDGIELTEVVRQKTEWLKQAVTLFADGDVRGCMTEFANADRLSFGKNDVEVRDNLLADWDKNRSQNLKDTTILAYTNKHVAELNQRAQDIRRHRGELEKSNFVWGSTKYYTGDRIAFHANNRELGVWNGDQGTIKAIFNPLTSYSVRFIVELDRGQTITFCPRDLGSEFKSSEEAISLGYATTIHKSQGMTVDKTFLMLDSKQANQELAYVGLTRSRYDTSIHCQTKHVEEDVVQYQKAKREFEKAASRSQAKQMAAETQRKMEEERRNEKERQRRNQMAQGHNL